MSSQRHFAVCCALAVTWLCVTWLGFDRATAHVNNIPIHPLDTCVLLIAAFCVPMVAGLISPVQGPKEGGEQ